MLVAAICAKNSKSAFAKIQKALSYPIDMVELRLDYLNNLKIAEIKKIKDFFDIPMIFTLRKRSQGGLFKGTEKKRLKIIESLFVLQPEYFDLEFDTDAAFIKSVHKKHQHVKLICSYHDFKKTPADLSSLFTSMIRKEFSIYKVATLANSTIDSLQMLNFVREYGRRNNICGLCMGELGKATRILSPIVNNCLNYVSIDAEQKTALGQLSLQELFEDYHYHIMNKKTHIYALLGNPVEQSIGHIFHNNIFQKLKQNAVYIKLQVTKEELPNFFQEVAKLPFKGFSVTMPLKESVVPYVKLATDAKKIMAVNTILCRKNKFTGFNTDGVGAINSIEKITRIKNKKIVILGAGGTAKAVVCEALKRKAKVIVINRTVSRAKGIAKTFGCKGYGLGYVKKLANIGYDILINTTSVGMGGRKDISLIPASAVVAGTIVLDMVYKPRITKLLQIAKAKKCIYITGEKAFINQAIEQSFLWLRCKHKA